MFVSQTRVFGQPSLHQQLNDWPRNPSKLFSFDTAEVTTISHHGEKYVLGFADHRTAFVWVYVMKHKDDAYTGVKTL